MWPAFLPDGTPDASFGSLGQVITHVSAEVEEARGVAIQADGKIVVVGTTGADFFADFLVLRYLPDGSLDATFGSGGQVRTDIAGGADDAEAVALQTDGKIVLAGTAETDLETDFAVARYLADGTLDASFGTGGRVTTNLGGFGTRDFGRAVVVQRDGRIVVGGTAELIRSTDFALVRYFMDGSLDPSFGVEGKVTTDILNTNGIGLRVDEARAMRVLNDGRIVVTGSSGGFAGTAVTVARYRPDGSLDRSFNGIGMVMTKLHDFEDSGEDVTVQSDGKILVAGASTVSARESAAVLLRFRVNGSLDSTFASGGIANLVINSSGTSVALQQDGNIIVSGESYPAAFVARLLGDPPLDPTDALIATGTPVEGETPGTVFQEFGSPTIDGGQLGGTADVRDDEDGKQTVIYGDDMARVQVRTGGGDATGGIFTKLGDPIFGAGDDRRR